LVSIGFFGLLSYSNGYCFEVWLLLYQCTLLPSLLLTFELTSVELLFLLSVDSSLILDTLLCCTDMNELQLELRAEAGVKN